MKKFIIKTKTRKLLADTITPVSIYLRIRDVYPNSLFLESSDYHGNENSYSFICLKPLAGFEVDNGIATETYPDGVQVILLRLPDHNQFSERFRTFLHSFEQAGETGGRCRQRSCLVIPPMMPVRYFENIKLQARVIAEQKIPEVRYIFTITLLLSIIFRITCILLKTGSTENPANWSGLKRC